MLTSEDSRLFEEIYERMIVREGGYVNHTVPGDRGGQTYAGIARNANPNWDGWKYLDSGQEPPADAVRQFYRQNYWEKIQGDSLNPVAAEQIFDFAVNAGITTAVRLAQICVKTTPDGRIGAKTISAINEVEPEVFRAIYSLAKVARYAEICNRDRSQSKFLLGWINRVLGMLK